MCQFKIQSDIYIIIIIKLFLEFLKKGSNQTITSMLNNLKYWKKKNVNNIINNNEIWIEFDLFKNTFIDVTCTLTSESLQIAI